MPSTPGATSKPPERWSFTAVVLAQPTFTYVPFMHELFESRVLLFADGALIIGLGIGLFFVREAEKVVMRRMG